ncbi:thermonuclease family protein (plasmid) [Arthrobacter sp. G.S.26]|uniref:thermonuclease family protein n=1 Tax=Arthrobacter sp. G.S.26 TaxID=3433706 RepID=UPI003D7712BC
MFLFGDTAQGERDRYGRLLAYVFTTDALLESVNETIHAQGHGREADYGKGYIYRDTFQARSLKARNNAEGVWACPD